MIYEIDIKDYLSNLQSYMVNKSDTVVVYNSATCVLQGADELNTSYCYVNQIPIYKTHGFGGTIVNFAGDICIGNYQPNFNNFGQDFLKYFANWLTQKGLQVLIDGNDVLVDGKYKVASFMSQYTNGCLYTAIHISVNMDLELIKNICTKPMNKVPKGLSSYGIDSKNVKEWIFKWLTQIA